MARMIQQADGSWREPPGHEALWRWFGLSYASWLTIPRVLMHAMPDDWQARMAELLREYDAAWDFPEEVGCPIVNCRTPSGRMTRWPEWVLNYRHPDEATIEALRAPKEPSHG